MMGGIEWGALPTIVEILGVEDIELLIRQLGAIREHQHKVASR